MKYLQSICKILVSGGVLFEMTASFTLFFFYFTLIQHLIVSDVLSELMLNTLVLGFIYFIIYLIFSKKSTIQILPVVSYIEFMKLGDSNQFFLRICGQFLSALNATVLHIIVLRFGGVADFGLYATPLNPFLTAIFIGFLAMLIYFLYIFILKIRTPNLLRYFVFLMGLSIVFIIISRFTSISLLNPRFLFHYLLNGNQITFNFLTTGILIHALTPMIMIACTHLFFRAFTMREKL